VTRMAKTKKERVRSQTPAHAPWISMRAGLVLIALISVGMAVLTIVETLPAGTWQQAILAGVSFGGLLWIIFFGLLVFNRWTRRQ
jgi:hypothetical protein